MTTKFATPWHRESFDRLMSRRLPELLAERVPLAGYAVESTGPQACRVRMAVGPEGGVAEAVFDDLPQPDETGLFAIEGREVVVVALASCEQLDRAEVRCVGEQLYDFIEARLGEAPGDLRWDEALIRSWVPLDRWLGEFLNASRRREALEAARLRALFERAERKFETPVITAQVVDNRNWLSRTTHLRRMAIPSRKQVVAPGQLGRACPIETPEGPNIGRVLSVALGAEIRDGRLVVVDDRPEAKLGPAASMIPFLEHDGPNRALMGANMLRQWEVPPDPECPLVRTGNEPDAKGFWCGRDLLTAFVSWGRDVFEDGILVSVSAAERLDFPHALEPGDKLSNRHGAKGVVSRILPDDEMPHLPDGTPVELIFSFLGCHTRLNFGQIREAVMSRIARAEGTTAIVPPFAAPSDTEIRERLKAAGLPQSGMETLRLGRDGPPLKRPSTVGWIYWGKTHHLAASKLHCSITPDGPCQRQSELEYFVLRDAGAFATVAETFNLRGADRPDADTLAQRVAAGQVAPADPPTPTFVELQRRLAAAGIRADLADGKLTFAWAAPPGETLTLARPVAHPWLKDHEVAEIGRFEELGEHAAVVEANARLARMCEGQAPPSLADEAVSRLAAAIEWFLDALLTPEHLRLDGRTLFSGRSVIAPAYDLRFDQLGLPDEIAWTLFGPLVAREVGQEAADARTDDAAAAVDRAMADSWVLLSRAPAILPTSILAFRPVRIRGRAIRVHPIACRPLNGDYDGDQAAVFLPLTEETQAEAAGMFSLAAHLRRAPELIDWCCASHDPMWGLAELSRTPEGLAEIRDLATVAVAAPEGIVTRSSLIAAMRELLARDGADETLTALERLMDRGFEVAKASGASVSPLLAADLGLPTPPDGDDEADWEAYDEDLAERIVSRTDYDDDLLGPQLLALKSQARGWVSHLQALLGGTRVEDVDGQRVAVRHALAEGLPPGEYYRRCVASRRGLGQVAVDVTRRAYGVREAARPGGFTVLARAMRAKRPGIVFAHAAAVGEVDPLTDLDTRLFVGLPVEHA